MSDADRIEVLSVPSPSEDETHWTVTDPLTILEAGALFRDGHPQYSRWPKRHPIEGYALELERLLGVREKSLFAVGRSHSTAPKLSDRAVFTAYIELQALVIDRRINPVVRINLADSNSPDPLLTTVTLQDAIAVARKCGVTSVLVGGLVWYEGQVAATADEEVDQAPQSLAGKPSADPRNSDDLRSAILELISVGRNISQRGIARVLAHRSLPSTATDDDLKKLTDTVRKRVCMSLARTIWEEVSKIP